MEVSDGLKAVDYPHVGDSQERASLILFLVAARFPAPIACMPAGGFRMATEVKQPLSAEKLQATPAVQKVSRWRLPNSDGDYRPEENVKFAKQHGNSFFRAAAEALDLIIPKNDEAAR